MYFMNVGDLVLGKKAQEGIWVQQIEKNKLQIVQTGFPNLLPDFIRCVLKLKKLERLL